ncbi:MAG: hypothetical protein HY043_20155 [Verrucomicrobia bacterium]|nr:hypothetical protein [Verrucomicrobiota bacterium]
MRTISHIPNSLRSAGRELRLSLAYPLERLSHEQFVRAWSAVAYLFPGLHLDGYEDAESGWLRALKRFAAEAWRRADAGELADEELYCCDAQWSGLYDRMHTHAPDEMERRLALAADYGEQMQEK